MARTTLVIPDELLRRLKKKAADEGSSFQAVATELLRRGVGGTPRSGYRLDWRSSEARLQPGVDLDDRASLFEAMVDEK